MTVMRALARKCLIGLMVALYASVPIDTVAQSSDPEKTSILSAARQRYYNLKQAGLIEFQANIQTNWGLLLADTGTKSSTISLLERLPFSFSIDPEGKLRLDHGLRMLPPNQRPAETVLKIFKGMDDSVSGFFRIWSIFLLNSPFPQVGSDYTIDKPASGYKFSQRQAELFVEIVTDNDFVITEIRVSAPELTASLKPDLEKTPAGFLLKGYIKQSQRVSGARATTVKVSLEYEAVSGLQLLHKVNLDTSFEGVPAKIEWVFTGYEVKVR